MSDPIIGYRYSMGVHMGISRGPVDELVEVRVGDKTAWPLGTRVQTGGGVVSTWNESTWTLTTSYTPETFTVVGAPDPVRVSLDGLTINAPSLFGGEGKEGGVVGKLDVMMGEDTQPINPRLSAMLGGALISAFRGMFTLFYDGVIASLNPYPKPWKFRVRRSTKGWDGACWYPEKATINLYQPLSESGSGAVPTLQNVQVSESVRASRPSISDPWIANITPNGTLVSVDGLIMSGDWQGESWYTAVPVNGVDYTRVGNTFTFVGDSPAPGYAQYGITYGGTPIEITYTVQRLVLPPADIPVGYSSPEIKAMNPAHIIYECITNRDWGRGLSSAYINAASFTAAADTLYAEGFGLCMKWAREDTVDAFVQKVLDHIGAALYAEKSTGLITLKLIRSDYVVAALPIFTTENGILSIDDDSESTSQLLTNEIIVKYVNPVTNEDAELRVQNLAGIQATGAVNSKTVDYPGLPLGSLAARVGQRDLRVHGTPLRRLKLTMNRNAYAIEPGGVMRVSNPARGIADMVLRVGKIEDNQDSTIVVTAVQDVFGLAATAFINPSIPATVPSNDPSPALQSDIKEATYNDLVTIMSPSELAALTGDETYVYLVGAKPSQFAIDFKIYTGTAAGGYTDKGAGVWTPCATLTGAINNITNDGNLTSVTLPLSIPTGTVAIVDDEVLQVVSYNPTTGAFRFVRGCIDTLPAAHSAGALVWFPRLGIGYDPVRYAEAQVIGGKVLTRTGSGTLAESAATLKTVTTVGRSGRPYPVGLFKVNNVDYRSGPFNVRPDFVISWATRNKVVQADVVLHQLSPAVTADAGVTYTLRIRRASDNALLQTIPGITGSSYTYTEASWLSTGKISPIILDFVTVQNGVESWQHYMVEVAIRDDGWSFDWGNDFSNT